MKKLLLLVALVSVCFVRCSEPQQEQTKIISIYYDDDLIMDAAAAIKAGDPAIMPAYEAFKANVDQKYLTMEPLSIVPDKIHTAPSRDPRDYISLSPYWWPDPTKPDGVPYLRNDGVRNPEVYEYHERTRGESFGSAIESLAFMYVFSGEEKYAAKVSEMLYTWFLDPVLGMNPNMTYAQYVPGMERIRGTGIIDSRRFLTGLNAAQMIAGSPSWSAENDRALKDWANAFRYWLDNSINGLTEVETVNNHGLWFEVMRQICIMYTGDYEYLKEAIIEGQFPRIAEQVEPDGSLPAEIARTLGLHYCTFAMEALQRTANMGEKVGLDVWGYVAPNGRSMKLVTDYLKTFWKDPSKWEHMQINPFGQNRGATMLLSAGKGLNSEEYTNLAKEIGYESAPDNGNISNILYFKIRK